MTTPQKTPRQLALMKGAAIKAVAAEDIEKMRKLLKDGLDPHMETADGSSLFADAVNTTNLNLVTLMLNHGAIVDHQPRNGQTGMYRAVDLIDVPMIELLLNRGADINLNSGDFYTQTLLMQNAFVGDYRRVSLLLHYGADVNAVSSVGSTALTEAISRSQTEVIEILLKNGADINMKNREGKAAIDLAHQYRNPMVVAIIEKHILTQVINDMPGRKPLIDSPRRNRF